MFKRLDLLDMVLLSLATVMLFAVISIASGRTETNQTTAEFSEHEVIASRLLNFVDQAGGAVDVIDVQQNETLMVIQAGEGAFMRGILRALTSERRSDGHGEELPFELRAESSNRLLLIDKATGRKILLNAFGSDNAAFFERFLPDNTSLSQRTNVPVKRDHTSGVVGLRDELG